MKKHTYKRNENGSFDIPTTLQVFQSDGTEITNTFKNDNSMKNFTTLHGITKNKMGTLSIDLQISGMRKPQDFIFYGITKESKNLTIQSNTRIGTINLDGKGEMSKSHSGGAFFIHLDLDKLTPFEFNKSDWQQIVEYLGLTEGVNVGNSGISTDNSGAKSIFNL